MRTKPITRFSLLAAGTLLCAAQSCSPSPQVQTIDEDDAAYNQLDAADEGLVGTYVGTLPCADCGGESVELTFNADQTYELEYELLDKDEHEVEVDGVYTVVGDSLLELTAPSTGEKTYYRLVAGGVALSDSTGVLHRGRQSAAYVLRRE